MAKDMTAKIAGGKKHVWILSTPLSFCLRVSPHVGLAPSATDLTVLSRGSSNYSPRLLKGDL